MTDAEKFTAIQARVREVVAKATMMYQVDLSSLILKMNVKGHVAGWARCARCKITGGKTYSLRLNRDLILGGDSFDYMMNDNIPHEVAHLVCFANPSLGHQHNDGWRRICLALGGNGNRCHTNETTYAHGGFDYITSTGDKVTVSKIIHTRVQEGRWNRIFKRKGNITRYSLWCEQGGTPVIHATPPSPPPMWKGNFDLSTIGVFFKPQLISAPPVQPRPVAAGMTKAAQVRAWIAKAKTDGYGQDTVIHQAVRDLQMNRAQATRYVVENWMKA